MNTNPVETARVDYATYCESIGSDAMAEEEAIVSAVGVSAMPPAETVEYYAFLRSQTEQAQNEHDREIAAGRENG